jgi:hypothetical protein
MSSVLHDPDEPYVPPGTIRLSPAVVHFAREFITSVNGEKGNYWVAAIGWATSVTVKESPDAQPREIGPGLSLGAYRRHEVPPDVIDKVDGLEFVLHIPQQIWEQSSRRLIDMDESLLFKLRLL